jgi:YodL-like
MKPIVLILPATKKCADCGEGLKFSCVCPTCKTKRCLKCFSTHLTDKVCAFGKKINPLRGAIMIPYRFYYNSQGLVRVGDRFADGYRDGTGRDHIPSLDGYRPGDDLTLAWEGEFESAPNSTPGFSACEELFRIFNEPWGRPNEYAGPSMSVGDVVVFFPGADNEIAFGCDTTGFKKITGTFSDTHPQPESWKRDHTALVGYIRLKDRDGEQLTDAEWDILDNGYNG